MEKIIPKQKYYKNVANTIIQKLGKRQMEGYYCKDRASALQKALELIPKGSSVAWGGSMTIEETGIMDAIQKGDYKIINRDIATSLEEQREIYGKICLADFFLMSTNAITLEGELINIDGRCYNKTFRNSKSY